MRVFAAGFIGALLILSLFWLTEPAGAEDHSPPHKLLNNFYISGAAGATLTGDSDITGTGISTSAEFDPGAAVIGALGFDYGNNIRAELGLGFEQGSVDTLSGATNGTGDVDAKTLMLNGYYDFRNETPFWPYLGAGVGGAMVSYDGISPVGGSSIDDDDTVFAYQGIAGLRVRVTDYLSMFGDYRYLATTDPTLTTRTGTTTDAEYSSHKFMVGLSWSFGGTPRKSRSSGDVNTPNVAAVAPRQEPAMQPKPMTPKTEAAPAETRTVLSTPKLPEPSVESPAPGSYRLFFDWNEATLTRAGQRGLDFIVSKLMPDTVTRIEAEGHADRSGTQEFNMALSKLRAETVRTELIRQGIPAEWIEVSWKGESDPLIETDDGFRHPQNRRVEIVIKSSSDPDDQKMSAR